MPFSFILSLAAAEGPHCRPILQPSLPQHIAFKIHGNDVRFIDVGKRQYAIAVERFVGTVFKLTLRDVGNPEVVLTQTQVHFGLIEGPYLIDVHVAGNALLIVTRGGLEVVDLASQRFVGRESRKLQAGLNHFFTAVMGDSTEMLQPRASLRLKNKEKDYLLIGTGDAFWAWRDKPSLTQKSYILVYNLKEERVIKFAEIPGADHISEIQKTDNPFRFLVKYKIRDDENRKLRETVVMVDFSKDPALSPGVIQGIDN